MPAGLRYTPGGLYLAVGPTLAVLSSDPALVAQVWPLVRDGGDTAAVLADAMGGGFAALADFVLVEGGAGRVEILVRGDIDVTIEGSGSTPQHVDGRGVRTWREAAAERVERLCVGQTGDPSVELPLLSGIVRAQGFRWTATEESDGVGAAGVTERAVGAAPATPVTGVLAVPEPAASPARAEADAAAAVAVEPAGPAVPVPPMPPIPPWPPATTAPAASFSGETQLGPSDELGHLFESTVLRGPEEAAVWPNPGDDAAHAAAAQPAQLGDHDGSTILGGQLAALLRAGREPGTSAPSSLSASPATPAPATLELVFSTGQVVPLDRSVVVGRKPQVDRVSGSQIPRLITVDSPSGDISRSHLELKPDGAYLLATDLGSTNGTLLTDAIGTRPLTARGAQQVGVGARLDLGDGVTIDVRIAR